MGAVEECDFEGQVRLLLYMAIGPCQQKCRKVFGTTLPGQCQTSVGWSRTVRRKSV